MKLEKSNAILYVLIIQQHILKQYVKYLHIVHVKNIKQNGKKYLIKR